MPFSPFTGGELHYTRIAPGYTRVGPQCHEPSRPPLRRFVDTSGNILMMARLGGRRNVRRMRASDMQRFERRLGSSVHARTRQDA
jgi:hypothetical protein